MENDANHPSLLLKNILLEQTDEYSDYCVYFQ